MHLDEASFLFYKRRSVVTYVAPFLLDIMNVCQVTTPSLVYTDKGSLLYKYSADTVTNICVHTVTNICVHTVTNICVHTVSTLKIR